MTNVDAARLQGVSDGRYGYCADPGDWAGLDRLAYKQGYEQGVAEREREPARFGR